MYRYVGIYVYIHVSYVYTNTHTNDKADLLREKPNLKILNQGGKKISGSERGAL
jgi:hypothetical protein